MSTLEIERKGSSLRNLFNKRSIFKKNKRQSRILTQAKKLPPSVEGYQINKRISQVRNPLPSIPRGTCSDLSQWINQDFDQLLSKQNQFDNLPFIKANRKDDQRISETLGILDHDNITKHERKITNESYLLKEDTSNNPYLLKLDSSLEDNLELNFLPPVDIGQRIRISIPALPSPSFWDPKATRERGLSSPLPFLPSIEHNNNSNINSNNNGKQNVEDALNKLMGRHPLTKEITKVQEKDNNQNKFDFIKFDDIQQQTSELVKEETNLRYANLETQNKKKKSVAPPPLTLNHSTFKLYPTEPKKRKSKRSTLIKRVQDQKIKKNSRGQLKLMNPDVSPTDNMLNDNISSNNNICSLTKINASKLERELSYANTLNNEETIFSPGIKASNLTRKVSLTNTLNEEIIPSPPSVEPPKLERKLSEPHEPQTAFISMIPPPPSPIKCDQLNEDENDSDTANNLSIDENETSIVLQIIENDDEQQINNNNKLSLSDNENEILNSPIESTIEQFPLPPLGKYKVQSLHRSLSQPMLNKLDLSTESSLDESMDSIRLHSILNIDKRQSIKVQQFSLTPRDSKVLSSANYKLENSFELSEENSDVIFNINQKINDTLNILENTPILESHPQSCLSEDNVLNQSILSQNTIMKQVDKVENDIFKLKPDQKVLDKLNGVNNINNNVKQDLQYTLDVLINNEDNIKTINNDNNNNVQQVKMNQGIIHQQQSLQLQQPQQPINNIINNTQQPIIKTHKVIHAQPRPINKPNNVLISKQVNSSHQNKMVLKHSPSLHQLNANKPINKNNKFIITKKATEKDLELIGKLVESTEMKIKKNNNNKEQPFGFKRILTKVKQFI